MLAVVTDIDDTLIDTSRRRWAAWRRVLGRDIALEAVETQKSSDILKTYASSQHEIWKRFWSVLLCWEEDGIKLLDLDTPLPGAADVMKRWSKEHRIVYFTGRSANMYDLTLAELDNFGFPMENIDLVTWSLEDWHSYLESKTSAVQLRSKWFSSIKVEHEIAKAVDDTPLYFSVYKEFGVPERIGILRFKSHSPQEYLACGATKVVNEWIELL